MLMKLNPGVTRPGLRKSSTVSKQYWYLKQVSGIWKIYFSNLVLMEKSVWKHWSPKTVCKIDPFKGPLHTRHFCSRHCNIAIKRYCYKKTFFSQYFLTVCIEIFIFGQSCSLKPSLEIFWNVITIFLRKKYIFINMSFYLIIFLSQYCVWKCLVCIP
jgi:hypothetical protein